MKPIIEKTYPLNATSIDQMSEELETCMKKYPYLTHKDILKTRLSLEELLIQWNTLEEKQKVSLSIIEKRSHLEISLSLLTINYEFNPLSNELASLDNLLATLGMGWMHQFDSGINTVYIKIETRPTHKVRNISIAVLLAVISAIILRLAPDSIESAFSTYMMTPLFDICSNFLSAIISPIMFFAVITGITSISNPRILSTIGKDACINFLVGVFRIECVALVLCAIIFPFHFNFQKGDILLPFLEFLKDSVPDDIFSPFVNENMMQVVFLGIVIGVALLFLQKQLKIIPSLIDECNILLTKIISGFELMLPGFIYLSVVNVGLSANIQQFISFSRMFISFILFTTVVMILYFRKTSKVLNVPSKEIFKILKPTIDATLISSVSSASFSEAYEACETKFGVDSKLVGFSLPIGTVIHKPFIACEFIFFMSAAITSQGQALNLSNLLILGLLAFLMSVSYPPVSGGEFSCYTVLLKQMGLPISLLAFASALSGILDFMEAPCNVVATELRLLISAKRLNRMKDPK